MSEINVAHKSALCVGRTDISTLGYPGREIGCVQSISAIAGYKDCRSFEGMLNALTEEERADFGIERTMVLTRWRTAIRWHYAISSSSAHELGITLRARGLTNIRSGGAEGGRKTQAQKRAYTNASGSNL